MAVKETANGVKIICSIIITASLKIHFWTYCVLEQLVLCSTGRYQCLFRDFMTAWLIAGADVIVT